MAIDSTSHVTQLIEALRQQITNKAGTPVSTSLAASQSINVATSATNRKNTQRSLGTENLKRKLSARIAGLQGQNDQSFEAAIRIFVEGVLSFEFGDQLSQDPRFHEMLDGIVEFITKDPELQGQFKTLFTEMTTSGT
ncbi:MAG: hypothetical protein V4568_13460 [Pseudomonadota bacterium]